MSSSFNSHPSSYRDPSGFVFYKDGVLYRQVNKVFKKNFDLFINSGLYQHLICKKILIEHQTLCENLTNSADWHQTLQPEVLPFISYPYEWCFDMLKDAALVTLEAAKEAMNFDMMLKDASAYNIQLHKGNMIFIDTLSFEEYDKQKPWVAYRQFCEHFFAPLALMHYLKVPLQNLFIAYPDGIPLSVAAKMLPFKSKISLHTSLHIHFHASMSLKNRRKDKIQPFSKKKMKNLLQSLEDGIKNFSFLSSSGVWSEYYKEAKTRNSYVDFKKNAVQDLLKDLLVKTLFDAGANEGEFSLLMHEKYNHVVSADLDHCAVNQLYNNIKQKEIPNILPLMQDLANPSPGIGLNNKERAFFSNRIKVDLVLALALIHHLVIGKNIPFEAVAEMFHSIGKYLLIEFVPKEDEKVQYMLNQKKDIYTFYSEGVFLKSFSQKFSIIKQQKITGSNRTLFLMKAYENYPT